MRREGIRRRANTTEMMCIHTSLQAISDSKSSIQVSIALNLKETEAAQYYKECWKLTQLDNLYQIYEEIKDDIGSFVKLYRLSKAAGMNTQHVIRLLVIANNAKSSH